MRKILLIAAVLFSLGSMAQRPLSLNQSLKTLGNNLKVNSMMAKLSSENLNTPAKAPAKAPEGRLEKFYLDFYNYCYGFGLLPEYHKAIDIIYGDNNTVYIKNMLYSSLFDTYIEGELDGDTIRIKNGQSIGSFQGYDMVLCKLLLDETTGDVTADTENEVKLAIDNEFGIISSNSTDMLGIFTSDYQIFFTLCAGMSFIPENLFPAADEFEYTYDYEAYQVPKVTDKKSTVQIINLGTISYIKGLMPENNPDSWMIADNEEGQISLTLPQVIEDDVAAAFIDFANGGKVIEDPVAFKYDATSGCYTMSQYEFTNLFATEDELGNLGLAYSESYSNLRIKATSTGINKIENSDADVVSTEYFDLSGRRISNAQKGINVKVMKLSDGTTKTVKVVK